MSKVIGILSAAAVCLSCSTDKDELRARVADACSIACEQALALKCPAEKKLTGVQCNARCMSLYDGEPSCHAEYAEFSDCVAEQKAASWQCNVDGEADVLDGVCTTEYDLLSDCMTR